jgi:hypothetical protein
MAGIPRAHRGAALIGLLFLLLSLVYNITVPIWEADNEWSHYLYVRRIIETGSLPSIDTAVKLPEFTDLCRNGEEILISEGSHQFRQPPLYYLGGAAASFWVTIDTAMPMSANQFRLWDPDRLGYNFALHRADEGFPYRGTALAVHVLRLYSGFIGVVGLIAAYLLGLLIFGGRRELALAVMAVNAFIPQYVFSASTINNDILVATLGAWCIYLCLRVLARQGSYWTLLLASLLAGLAITAKYNGVILVPLVAMTAVLLVLRSLRDREQTWASVAWRLGLVLVLGVVPAIVWFARNTARYDQLVLGYPALYGLQASVSQVASVFPRDLPDAIDYSLVTFWGLMGWGTLPLPSTVQFVLSAISGLALVGVFLYLLDRRELPDVRGMVLLLVLLVLFGWLAGGFKQGEIASPRGRYLLPAFSAVSVLLVIGVRRVLPSRLEPVRLWGLPVGLFLLTAAVPVVLLEPAYAPPELAASPDLLDGEQPLFATFGDVAELVGYRVRPEQVAINDPIQVTLVWRGLQETPNNYTISINLVDKNGFSHAEAKSHPGRGNFPTSRWQEGDVFRDTYELRWTMGDWEWWPGGARVQVMASCFGPQGEHQPLPVVDQEGRYLGQTALFDRIKVTQAIADEVEVPPGDAVYSFGGQLALEAYWLPQEPSVADGQIPVVLVWRALDRPVLDYMVSLILVDGQKRPISAVEHSLSQSYYPSTLWEAGEQVQEQLSLPLPMDTPSGDYTIQVGLRDSQSGRYLAVRDSDGALLSSTLAQVIRFSLTNPRVPVPVADLDRLESLSYRFFLPLVMVEAVLSQ